jgi:hypothetical protein
VAALSPDPAARCRGRRRGAEKEGESWVITHPENHRARRDDEQTSETSTFLDALRRHACKQPRENDIEELARGIDRELRAMASNMPGVPSSESDDLAQQLLIELFVHPRTSRQLDAIARQPDDDADYLGRVRGRLYLRLKTRAIDRIRSRERRRAREKLESQWHERRLESPHLLNLKALLETLADAAALPDADPFDRLLIGYMARNAATISETARAYGIHHYQVSRALERLAPQLRKAFAVE